MDYEKLHKDTITKLQEMVNSGKITAEIARGICADFVPESEDERIRKEMITYLSTVEDKELIPYESWITWLEKQGEHANFRNKIQIGDKVTRNEDGVLVNLSQLKRVAKKDEKQGEQKPAELPKGEDYGIDGLYHAIRILEETIGSVDGYQSDDGILEHKCAISAVKQLAKQNNTWSEEDENYKDALIGLINEIKSQPLKRLEDWDSYLNWLKSLKDRYTWKPSELQIEALESTTENCAYSEYQDCLRELIGQLKKLKE